MIKRGALVILEGCDRTGKSTQSKKLVAALNGRGIKAESMSFPDRTTRTGQLIDSYLRKEMELPDKAVHLLFTANRWELQPYILRQLHAGVTLVVDRYSYSGVAFSAAKKGLDIDWCSKPERGLPKPDVVLFLDMDADGLCKRGGFGDERYENADFQKSVHDIYLKLKDETWQIVNADQSVDKVNEDLIDCVLKTIEKVKHFDVGQLWCNGILNGKSMS